MYAAGDVIGLPFLASVGTAQGTVAVNAMFGSTPQRAGDDATEANECLDPKSLAKTIWSTPEAACYGLSLQQAKDSGIDADVGAANYTECLRGRVFSPNGMLKLVFSKPTGQILGVHIYGDHAW